MLLRIINKKLHYKQIGANMKKYFTYVLFALFFSAMSIYSQQSQSFKAKEGFSVAVEAIKSQGLSDPQLVMISSYNMTVDTGQGDFAMEFDFDTGESTMWIYTFKDSDGEGRGSVVVIKMIVFIPFPINLSDYVDTSELPVNMDVTVGTSSWIDSDVMSSNLNADSDFTTFINDNPEPETVSLMLFNNQEIEGVAKNEPFWGVMSNTQAGESIMCVIHAETGDVSCQVFTNVEVLSEGEAGIQIYPNPAIDEINIELNQGLFQQGSTFKIISINGNNTGIIVNINSSTNAQANVSELASGTYYLLFDNKNINFTVPFLINR